MTDAYDASSSAAERDNETVAHITRANSTCANAPFPPWHGICFLDTITERRLAIIAAGSNAVLNAASIFGGLTTVVINVSHVFAQRALLNQE